MIFINGETFQFESTKNLSLFFKELHVETPKGIAVAINNKVIPRSRWDQHLVNDNDHIIIIKATQGG